jgi:hypothetical protein
MRACGQGQLAAAQPALAKAATMHAVVACAAGVYVPWPTARVSSGGSNVAVGYTCMMRALCRDFCFVP